MFVPKALLQHVQIQHVYDRLEVRAQKKNSQCSVLGVFQSECMHTVLTNVNQINIGCSLVSGVYSKCIKLYEN